MNTTLTTPQQIAEETALKVAFYPSGITCADLYDIYKTLWDDENKTKKEAINLIQKRFTMLVNKKLVTYFQDKAKPRVYYPTAALQQHIAKRNHNNPQPTSETPADATPAQPEQSYEDEALPATPAEPPTTDEHTQPLIDAIKYLSNKVDTLIIEVNTNKSTKEIQLFTRLNAAELVVKDLKTIYAGLKNLHSTYSRSLETAIHFIATIHNIKDSA